MARSDPPRRLRINVVVEQGGHKAETSAWLPLARGQPVKIGLELREEQGQPLPQPARPSQDLELEPPPLTDAVVQDMYRKRKQQLITDAEVVRRVGEELYVVFLAQQQVDGETGAATGTSTMVGEGPLVLDTVDGDSAPVDALDGRVLKRKSRQLLEGDEGGNDGSCIGMCATGSLMWLPSLPPLGFSTSTRELEKRRLKKKNTLQTLPGLSECECQKNTP